MAAVRADGLRFRGSDRRDQRPAAKADHLQSELTAAQEKLSELHEVREEMGYLEDEEEPGNLVGVELEPGVLGPLSGSVRLTLVKPEKPCTMEQMTRLILQQIVAAAIQKR